MAKCPGCGSPQENVPPGWNRPWSCSACLHAKCARAYAEALAEAERRNG